MYLVISYWEGETDVPMAWIKESEGEARDLLARMWKKSNDAAMQDENYCGSRSYCQEDTAVVAWTDGLLRHFDIIRPETEECL